MIGGGKTVTVNKKCLSAEDSVGGGDEQLPYCNILDKIHDSVRLPQNISAAAASSFDSVEPIYNEDFLFDKYGDEEIERQSNDNSIQNKPAYKRKGRFLDGSFKHW